MRFRTLSDCQQVLNLLQQRGMEVQVQRPRTGRPHTASSQMRPLTSHSHSPYFEPPQSKPRGSGFNLAPVEAGSLSQTPRPSHQQSVEDRAYDEIQPRSLVGPAQRMTYDENGVAGVPRLLPLPSAGSSGMHPHNSQAQGFDQNPRPFTSPVKSAEVPQIQSMGAVCGPSTIPESSSTLRASSTTIPVFPESLEHEIPPRRELPFKRPESKSKPDNRKTARPTTGTLELPPLPRPRTSHSSSLSHVDTVSDLAIGSDDSRSRTASPAKSSIIALNDDRSETGTGKAIKDTQPGSAIRERPQTAGLQTVRPLFSPMEALLARRGSIDIPSTGTGIPRVSSLLDAPHEVVSAPWYVQSVLQNRHCFNYRSNIQ